MGLSEEKREFASWWLWILFLGVPTAIGLTALGYFGLVGRTVVEREVFEQSYQRAAGQEQKIATFKAQLAEIEQQLTNPDLDATTKSNLLAQQAAIRVQLQAAQAVSQ